MARFEQVAGSRASEPITSSVVNRAYGSQYSEMKYECGTTGVASAQVLYPGWVPDYHAALTDALGRQGKGTALKLTGPPGSVVRSYLRIELRGCYERESANTSDTLTTLAPAGTSPRTRRAAEGCPDARDGRPFGPRDHRAFLQGKILGATSPKGSFVQARAVFGGLAPARSGVRRHCAEQSRPDS